MVVKDSGMPLEYTEKDGRKISGDLIDSASDILVDSRMRDDYVDPQDAFDNFLVSVSDETDIDKRSSVYSKLDLVDIERIPGDVWRIHGCGGCDWKGGRRCPYRTSPDILSRINICGKRRFYLWYMTRDLELQGTRKRYTLSQWTEGYMKNRMHMDLNDRYNELNIALKRLDSIEREMWSSFGKDERGDFNEIGKLTNNDLDQLGYLENRRKELRKEYDDLMKFLLKTEQLEVERDRPKELNINVRNSVSIDDIQRVINIDNDKIVDSEYEIIEDEDFNE